MTIKRLAFLIATAAAITSASPLVLAQNGRQVVDFSGAHPDGLPEGFVAARTGKGAPAEWKVRDDPTANGGRVLEQTNSDRTDHRFPLAIYQGVSAANLDVTVRFKAVAGQVDRAGGIAVRLSDPDNYYVVRANALEGNVNLYRVVKGVRSQIQGFRTKVSSDTWHTLGIRAEGNRFAVSFDGKPLFTAGDRTFSGAGKVALWTKADSVTRFDALTITTLP